MLKNCLLPFNFLLIFLLPACHDGDKKADQEQIESHKITKHHTYPLSAELKEISGITFINDSLIAAIEDEHGIVYFYNIQKNKIVRKLEFSKPDDFEDLVVVGKDIFAVSSNGNIYKIVNFAVEKPQIVKYKTSLKKKNDVEGIAYDSSENRLLLSTKGENLDGKEQIKSVYSFSLKNHQLDEKPYLDIDIEKLKDYFSGDKIEEASKDFLEALGNKSLKKVFTPTAMSFHPQTQELYIISSINNMILVYQQKRLVRYILFRAPEFAQAEGLAFNSQSELYISNEGKKQIPGNIIKVEEIL